MKNIILALSCLMLAAGARAAVLINGNQINPQTAISIATFTVTGSSGMTGTRAAFSGPISATSITGSSATITSSSFSVSGAFVVSNGSVAINASVQPGVALYVNGTIETNIYDLTSPSTAGNLFPSAGAGGVNISVNGAAETAVKNSRFSVGVSSFVVNGGSATVAYSLTAGSLVTSSATISSYNIAGSWYSWTPTWTGFSADPTGSGYYIRIGKTVTVSWSTSNSPTSNATGLTFTLPFPAARDRAKTAVGVSADNGVNNVSVIYLNTGSAVATAYYGPTLANWTNSGTKDINFTFTYEAQ